MATPKESTPEELKGKFNDNKLHKGRDTTYGKERQGKGSFMIVTTALQSVRRLFVELRCGGAPCRRCAGFSRRSVNEPLRDVSQQQRKRANGKVNNRSRRAAHLFLRLFLRRDERSSPRLLSAWAVVRDWYPPAPGVVDRNRQRRTGYRSTETVPGVGIGHGIGPWKLVTHQSDG